MGITTLQKKILLVSLEESTTPVAKAKSLPARGLIVKAPGLASATVVDFSPPCLKR
jgi:hypothetical protein